MGQGEEGGWVGEWGVPPCKRPRPAPPRLVLMSCAPILVSRIPDAAEVVAWLPPAPRLPQRDMLHPPFVLLIKEN